MRKSICSLQFDKAVDAIKDKDTVMYKHGVWNSYEKKPVADVIKWIKGSGYGADVDLDESTGMLYVCTPASSDMW